MSRIRGSLHLVSEALPIRIQQRMSELGLSFNRTDAVCDLPKGTTSSVVYGKSRRPSPKTLQNLARGLQIPYRELALAAYGILNEDPDDSDVSTGLDSSAPAASNEAQWAKPPGRVRAAASIAT